jgi:hypothetical protein
VTSDGHNLDLGARQGRHVLHQEVADHDAFVRAGPVRPLRLLESGEQHPARLGPMAWSGIGQHHVSIGTGINSSGIESFAAECAGRARLDHERGAVV